MPMINYKALKKLKAITVLTLATFGSDALEFNHKAFQDEISKIYTIDSSLQTLNAKSVLDELFDFDRMVLSNERKILENALLSKEKTNNYNTYPMLLMEIEQFTLFRPQYTN